MRVTDILMFLSLKMVEGCSPWTCKLALIPLSFQTSFRPGGLQPFLGLLLPVSPIPEFRVHGNVWGLESKSVMLSSSEKKKEERCCSLWVNFWTIYGLLHSAFLGESCWSGWDWGGWRASRPVWWAGRACDSNISFKKECSSLSTFKF